MKLILELLGYALVGAFVIGAIAVVAPYGGYLVLLGLCCLIGGIACWLGKAAARG